MARTTRIVDDARDLIKERLAELEDERKRLKRALGELGGRAVGKTRGRPRASAVGTGPKRRRRRKGTRAEKTVKLIGENPGITASEVAKAMKMKPNYLYRVLRDLEKEGRIKKDGRKYQPAK